MRYESPVTHHSDSKGMSKVKVRIDRSKTVIPPFPIFNTSLQGLKRLNLVATFISILFLHNVTLKKIQLWNWFDFVVRLFYITTIFFNRIETVVCELPQIQTYVRPCRVVAVRVLYRDNACMIRRLASLETSPCIGILKIMLQLNSVFGDRCRSVYGMVYFPVN